MKNAICANQDWVNASIFQILRVGHRHEFMQSHFSKSRFPVVKLSSPSAPAVANDDKLEDLEEMSRQREMDALARRSRNNMSGGGGLPQDSDP
jgi:hypothetical protein